MKRIEWKKRKCYENTTIFSYLQRKKLHLEKKTKIHRCGLRVDTQNTYRYTLRIKKLYCNKYSRRCFMRITGFDIIPFLTSTYLLSLEFIFIYYTSIDTHIQSERHIKKIYSFRHSFGCNCSILLIGLTVNFNSNTLRETHR